MRIPQNSRGSCLDLGYGLSLELSFLPADYANFAGLANSLREWHKICSVRVVPVLIQDLILFVEFFFSVTDYAKFAGLTNSLCEWREICSFHDQLSSFVVIYKRLTETMHLS